MKAEENYLSKSEEEEGEESKEVNWEVDRTKVIYIYENVTMQFIIFN